MVCVFFFVLRLVTDIFHLHMCNLLSGKALLRLIKSGPDLPNKFGEIHRIALTKQQQDIVEARMCAIEAPAGFLTPNMRHLFTRLGQLSTYECFKFWV